MGQQSFYCVQQFCGQGGPLHWRINSLLSTGVDREALQVANEGGNAGLR